MLIGFVSKFWVEPRSPFSYISHQDPKTLGKRLIIVSWPECRPEFPRDGGGDGFPRTLDIWRSPVPTCPGTKYPVRESLTSMPPKGDRTEGFLWKERCLFMDFHKFSCRVMSIAFCILWKMSRKDHGNIQNAFQSHSVSFQNNYHTSNLGPKRDFSVLGTFYNFRLPP